jgi:hypothetical protein
LACATLSVSLLSGQHRHDADCPAVPAHAEGFMTPTLGCLTIVALASFSGAVIGLIAITGMLELVDRIVRRRRQMMVVYTFLLCSAACFIAVAILLYT